MANKEENTTANQGNWSCASASTGSGDVEEKSTADEAPLTLTGTSRGFEEVIMDYLDRHPKAIARMEMHRYQHMETVGSDRSKLAEEHLPSFGDKKPYPPPLPKSEAYVVEFDGPDDPLHAHNWSLRQKLFISSILVFDSLAATMASSLFGAGSAAVQQEFNVGGEVATLGTSLFVLGYCFGPIIFAPMSELYGRRLPIISAAVGFGIFNIAVAVAKDLQTVMICRFFAGVFGACPLTVVAAALADMFDNKVRGLAIAAFSATIISGPLAGPFIGGFIAKSYLGWRWTAYVPAFMGFAAGFLALLYQKESYSPTILVNKAKYLRRVTDNWGIHAKQEEVQIDLRELLIKNVGRPLRMLFTEPIILLVTTYLSFIYGLLYLSLTAYTLIFQGVYEMSLGVSGLPLIGMIIGVFFGLFAIVALNPGYVRKLTANNDIPIPEWRLILPMAGGIVFAIGLFWLGWTGYVSSIPWIVPTLSGLALGFGIYTVFLQCINYILDAYLAFSASALAANTIMRSLFGAVFPLFATYMFNGIGINWAMTLLGCVAVLFVPMPFVFYRYGKKIRAKSKFAPAPDLEQDNERGNDSKEP